MRCIRCGKEMFTSSTNGDNICFECKKNSYNNSHIYIPNNCDIPMPQGFGKQEGWICPVCGRGVAPWVDYCPCQSDFKITYGTSTGGDVDLSEYQDMMDRIQKALDEGEIKL